MQALTRVFRRKHKAEVSASSGAVRKLNRKIESLKKRNLKIELKLGRDRERDNASTRQRRWEENLRKNREKISKLEIEADDLKHVGMIRVSFNT